jgi:nucleoside-diphosphate-sugar epimerase
MMLLTGGAGFLGRHVRAALGEQVIAPRRAELDLSDFQAVIAFLEQNQIDTVIHLAASLDRRDDAEAREKQWRDTFESTRVVLEASARAGVERVIAAGSMDEVGVIEGLVGPEAPASPMSTYGLCKTLALQTARFVASRSDLRVEWFRPATIYGPGQDGPMLVPSAFRSGASGEPTPFTSGEQKRDFVYVGDVADWIVDASNIEPTDEAGVRVHHVGSGNPVAVADVLTKIAALTGGRFELGAIPRRAGEPDLFGVAMHPDDRTPLAGWVPRVSLDEGLERTWQNWKSQFPGRDVPPGGRSSEQR